MASEKSGRSSLPTRTALLKELDSRPHGARVARMATLAHHNESSAELDPLLAELSRGDAYEAGLAVVGASASNKAAPLKALLLHPSLRVKLSAASAWARAQPPLPEVLSVLESLPPRVQRALLKALTRTATTPFVDSLFVAVRAKLGDGTAAVLLGGLSESRAHEAVEALAHAVPGWSSLARTQPSAVAKVVEASLSALPLSVRPNALETTWCSAIALLARYQPKLTLDLLERSGPLVRLPRAVLAQFSRLCRADAARTLALWLQPDARKNLAAGGLPPGAKRWARVLTADQRMRVVDALKNEPALLAQFLRRLPPPERAALFSHSRSQRPANAPESLALLRVLPNTLRDAEARRMLGQKAVRESPEQRMEVLALGAIETAIPDLSRWCQSARAEDRMAGWRLLFECVARCRRGLTETTPLWPRLHNDQDTVRAAALTALARVPTRLFIPDVLPHFAALSQAAIDARDTSSPTHRALRDWAFAQMRALATSPSQPAFQQALRVLQQLQRHTGAIALPNLSTAIPKGAEHALFDELWPFLQAASARESHQSAIALASALGKRAWPMAQLQKLLEAAIDAKPDHVASSAVDLWLRPPSARDERVSRLIVRDPSAIAIERVSHHLSARRQDLLDPFLESRVLKGQFLTGKTRYVPGWSSGFHRWLPRQQAVFARTLEQLAGDPERSQVQRASALARRATLPITRLTDLETWTQDTVVTVAEAALEAVSRLDDLTGTLDLLGAHLDSNRARVAIYAIPRVAERVPGKTLQQWLDSILTRPSLKVTVHKEAVRLLGAFPSDGAAERIEKEWHKEKLHRDVRIALGHAARALVEDPAAWRVLEALFEHRELEQLEAALRVAPSTLALRHRARYAALILKSAQSSDPRQRSVALSALGAWLPWCKQAPGTAAEELVNLSTPKSWQDGARLLVASLETAEGADPLKQVMERLAGEPVQSEGERDGAARQRLVFLLGLLGQLEPLQYRRAKALVLTCLDLAEGQDVCLWRATFPHRARAAVASGNPGFRAFLKDAATSPPIDGERLADWVLGVEQALAWGARTWPTEELLPLARDCVATFPPAALALVRYAGPLTRWPDEARGVLQALRASESFWIRSQARSLFTRTE